MSELPNNLTADDFQQMSDALEKADIRAQTKAMSEMLYEMAKQLSKANSMLANHKLSRSQASKEHHKNKELLTKYKRSTGNWNL